MLLEMNTKSVSTHIPQTLYYFLLQVPSYGGKLRYVIRFNIPDIGPSSGRVGPDVRIEVQHHSLSILCFKQKQHNRVYYVLATRLSCTYNVVMEMYFR